jgi:hypothetical protein
MKLFEKLQGPSTVTGAAMTAREAFKSESNPNGIFEKEELITYLKSLSEVDCQHLETLFSCMHEELRMINSLMKRHDKAGNPYYWLNFLRAKAQEGVKILHHEGLLNLIKLYRDGKVKIDFTIDDLVDEALS